MMHLHPTMGQMRNDFDPMAAAFSAGQEIYKAGLLTVINGRRHQQGLPPLDWPKVGTTPRELVWQEGPTRLYRYRAEAPTRAPILLVCSLINRPYVLDLLPERS